MRGDTIVNQLRRDLVESVNSSRSCKDVCLEDRRKLQQSVVGRDSAMRSDVDDLFGSQLILHMIKTRALISLHRPRGESDLD